MRPCVYTTQFQTWLKEGSACAPTESVCFRSNKRWATAAKLLERHAALPVLFRQQEDSNAILACRFVAELTEIRFLDRFEDDVQRRAWLDEKLWLQRKTIKKQERTKRFPTWESQYKAWEVDKFIGAKTWYVVRNVRQIRPLPLPRLRKLTNNQPLADTFIRGYALCYYPSQEIVLIGEPAAKF